MKQRVFTVTIQYKEETSIYSQDKLKIFKNKTAYNIKCMVCGKVHVREKSRQLATRVEEHQRNQRKIPHDLDFIELETTVFVKGFSFHVYNVLEPATADFVSSGGFF